MIKNILGFFCYINTKRYYLTSGDSEAGEKTREYEAKIKKNNKLLVFLLFLLENALLAINVLMWSVIVVLFVFAYLFLFLPLCVAIRILSVGICFILDVPGARLKWLEKKAKEEEMIKKDKSNKWQKRHQLSLQRWENSGKKMLHLEVFDNSAYIKALEKIRGINK